MKKLLSLSLAVLMMLAVLTGCGNSGSEQDAVSQGDTGTDIAAPAETGEIDWSQYHFGFSQDWNYIEWTQAMRDDIQAACSQYGIQLTVTDAGNSGEKQISDIEDLITLGVDAILISTYHADAIANATQEAMDSGIPVIVLSSEIPGVEPTCLVSADAVATGETCARYVIDKFPDGCNIIQLSGKEGSVVNQNRGIGFRNLIDADSKYTVLAEMSCNYERSLALTTMEDLIKVYGDKIDVVYTHNDDMALGAIQALKDADLKVNTENGILVVSAADGIYEEVLDAVEAGEMISGKYPTFGVEGVEVAMQILKGEWSGGDMIAESPLITKENVSEFR